MPREFSLLDALVPTLFVAFLASLVLQAVCDRMFSKFDLYRYVWHPPLFRVSLFVCIFGVLGLWVMR